MRVLAFAYFFLPLLDLSNEVPFATESSSRVLSRKRRYVVFPEGSTFSLAFCFTTRVLTPSSDIFTLGVNWGISYDLPNDTKSFQGSQFGNAAIASPLLLRRHRRDLYKKMEIILNSLGVDGRSCILRALCEASQRLLPSRGTIIHEMLRILFTMPLERLLVTEPPEHRIYDWAHRQGHRFEDCPSLFPSCPISLLDLALNAYT